MTVFRTALETRLQTVTKDVKNEKSASVKAKTEFDRWMNSDKDPGERFKGRFADPMKSGKVQPKP